MNRDTALHADSTAGRVVRRLVTAIAAVGLIAASAPAFAKSACYSAAEFEAEQAIRLHTELMVIGLTCHRLDAEQNLFGKYQQFTARHKATLMNWEKTLIGHFRQADKGNPTRRFDDFRTIIANQTAQRAALLTPPVFCQQHSGIINSVASLADADLRRFVAEQEAVQLADKPPCDTAVAQTPVTTKPAKAAKPQPAKSDKPAKAQPAKAQPAKADKPVKTASTAKP